MNFDRNGVLVTTSRPRPVLRKAYRTITVDSRDRDPTKYVRVNGGAASSDPGDYVVYFPRPFQKVTRIRLMNAALLGVQPSDTYIMMGIEGLNRIDECASGADRSGYVDSAFAKILNDRPVVATGAAYTFSTIVNVGNRIFTALNAPTSIFPTSVGLGNFTVAASNANGVTATYTSTNSVTPIPVGSSVNFAGFTSNSGYPNAAGYNGNFNVLSSTSNTITVFNPTIGGSGTSATAVNFNLTSAFTLTVSNATTTTPTFTFTFPHYISIGETLTFSNVGTTPANLTGVVTSVPSSTSLVLGVTTSFTGTIAPTSNSTMIVNNLQYAYSTTITTSFVTGQYLAISGLSNAGANVTTQILQASPSTGTTGAFETLNVNSGPITINNASGQAVVSQAIYYNDMSYAPNITTYNPPIGTLDRMHITLRRHLPLSSVSATNPMTAPITFGPAENTFTFEIEYIDNVFEDVSSFETRLDNADYTPKFQGNTA